MFPHANSRQGKFGKGGRGGWHGCSSYAHKHDGSYPQIFFIPLTQISTDTLSMSIEFFTSGTNMLVNDAALRDNLVTNLGNVANIEGVIQLLPTGRSNDVDILRNYRRSLPLLSIHPAYLF